MKKALSLILALALCLSLCACGGRTDTTNEVPTQPTEIKATISTNEGKTVELSAQDLFNEFDGNEARFNKIYKGATIKFVGTVKYIKTNTLVSTGDGTATSDQHKIVFEEGWCVIIGHANTTYDLADYYPGQRLEVSTGILDAIFDSEFTQDVADNNRVVWLVGNDKLWGEEHNTQVTRITPIEE